MSRRSIDTFVERATCILQKEHIVIGKERVPSFVAWPIIMFLVGVVVAAAFLASRSGTLEEGYAAAAAPTIGLVGHWKFDEGSGTQTADATLKSPPAQLLDGVAWISGKLANALSFDGIDDSVLLSNAGGINNLARVSMSAWIFPLDQKNDFGIIAKKSAANDAKARFNILISRDKKLVFRAGYTTARGVWTTKNPIPTNRWHHIAITYAYSLQETPSVYVDGVLQTLIRAETPAGSAVQDGTTLAIGANVQRNFPFTGSMDELKIYNRVLTAADVTALYKEGADARPNVIVIMTDDMDTREKSLAAMPNVQRLIAQEGITFTNNFATFPLCCPSRASLLTGQFSHNHGIITNNPPDGGYEKLDHTNTLPVALQKAGYLTGLFGKYLNSYTQASQPPVPPGWTRFFGFLDPPNFYNYKIINQAGTVTSFGAASEDYSTDVLAEKVVSFITNNARIAQPLFVLFTPYAPHLPATPAPRHEGSFSGESLPRPPSFNEKDVSDKPAFMSEWPLMDDATIQAAETDYRKRLESLRAVDEAVGNIITTLETTGRLANTVVIFTSDNGYFLGEHRLPRRKVLPYEESIRVPLIIRGPGFSKNTKSASLTGTVDLAPTIVSIAQANSLLPMDGQSLVSDPSGRNGILIEGKNMVPVLGSTSVKTTDTYTALRTKRYLYVEYDISGEKELYDLAVDPYQMDSRHANIYYTDVMADLALKLAGIKKCSGAGCWAIGPDIIPFSSPPESAVRTSPNAPLVAEAASTDTPIFHENLYQGMQGSQVAALQEFLKKEGVYNGPITGYYDALTEEGVQKHYDKYGIPGDQSGFIVDD